LVGWYYCLRQIHFWQGSTLGAYALMKKCIKSVTKCKIVATAKEVGVPYTTKWNMFDTVACKIVANYILKTA
jgi:hypothetical protein